MAKTNGRLSGSVCPSGKSRQEKKQKQKREQEKRRKIERDRRKQKYSLQLRQSIPYIRMLQDGICQVTKNFSQDDSVYDINYQHFK